MFTPAVLKSFRKDFAEAVKNLEQQYGVVIDLGNISYSADTFTTKMTVREGEDRADVNQIEWNKYCRNYGLLPEDFDKRFTWKGEDYVVVGIRPNKRTYPIACKKVSTGQSVSFTPEAAKIGLRG